MQDLLSAGLTMTYTGVFKGKNGKVVHVNFERKTESGTDCAEGIIPDCSFVYSKGFTENELTELKQFLQENSEDIFQMARRINKSIIYKL